MTSPTHTRTRTGVRVVVATALLASVVCGAAPFASAAPLDPIAPRPDSFGRYYVDAWASNTTDNTTPATNAAMGLLSPMLQYWTPAEKPVPAWDSNGKYLPESVGTVTNHTVLDANIAKSAEITQTRTPEQATAAYLIDRRNQNYSAIAGFGPYSKAFIDGSGAGTSIPDQIPADAVTVKYDDSGNANGRWAEPTSTFGPVVALVEKFRASSASTNPSKAYFNYARPFRWSDDVKVLPTLQPAKKSDADAFGDGGYPSGHTNAAWLASLAMAYSVPERFQELLTNASEIGNSRIVAGMHSPGDVIGGRMTATAIAAAALNLPANSDLKAQARANAAALLASPTTGVDAYADRAANEKKYVERLTYGLPRVGDTTVPAVVPKGAEALIESRLPYLTADQRRWVLLTTALPSGYAFLDDAEGWGRLNLFAAADGYSAFDTDVTATMNAADGGFSAADTWRNDIDGAGSLTKQGTGSLTLAGDNTFTGGVSVEGGSLAATSATAFGDGSVTVDAGTMSESVADPLLVDGDLTLSSASTLALTMGSSTPALAVKGAASFGGKLSLAIGSGFVPADDQVIATFGRLGSAPALARLAAAAAFDSVEVTGLPAGYVPSIEIRDNAVHLVNAAAVPASITAGDPTVGGSPIVGSTLTVSPGVWGPAPVALTYQWFRGSAPITGATDVAYTATSNDVGQLLSVTVTGTKNGFTSQSRTASASGTVSAAAVSVDPAAVVDPASALASTGVTALPAVIFAGGILLLGALLVVFRKRFGWLRRVMRRS